MPPRVHPSAIIDDGVSIGEDTAIWDNVHVRAPSTIGASCIIGEKTYVAYGVEIADRVKINAQAYICTGVSIETGVMISAGVIFTNDRFPRATTPDLAELRPSDPDETTEQTTVREGATIGSGSVIGPGLEIGRFAMVGMGSVVTKSVPDHALVVGNPARHIGFVCRCGDRLDDSHTCGRCARRYRLEDGLLEDAG